MAERMWRSRILGEGEYPFSTISAARLRLRWRFPRDWTEGGAELPAACRPASTGAAGPGPCAGPSAAKDGLGAGEAWAPSQSGPRERGLAPRPEFP